MIWLSVNLGLLLQYCFVVIDHKHWSYFSTSWNIAVKAFDASSRHVLSACDSGILHVLPVCAYSNSISFLSHNCIDCKHGQFLRAFSAHVPSDWHFGLFWIHIPHNDTIGCSAYFEGGGGGGEGGEGGGEDHLCSFVLKTTVGSPSDRRPPTATGAW